MIYLDPQGNDRTREVARYLAQQSALRYRENMLRRFASPVSLQPIPTGWTPPDSGAAQQAATP